MLLRLKLIGKLFYFVLKLGHLERQKVRSKEIVGSVLGAEGTPLLSFWSWCMTEGGHHVAESV